MGLMVFGDLSRYCSIVSTVRVLEVDERDGWQESSGI
jgi:hypothetical protein